VVQEMEKDVELSAVMFRLEGELGSNISDKQREAFGE